MVQKTHVHQSHNIIIVLLSLQVLVGLSELWNRYRSPVLPPQQQQLPQQQPEAVTMDTEEKVTKETANEDIGDRSDVRKRVKTVSLLIR